MATVTIIDENGKILKKNPKLIKEKTSEQILQCFKLDITQYILAIKTPAFVKTLNPETIPLNKYQDLVLFAKDKIDIDSVPDFALLILKSTEHGKTFLTFNVACRNEPEIIFPPYSYGFIPKEYSCKLVKDLLADLQQDFELPISNPQIFLNEENFPADNYVKSFLVKISRKVQLKFEFEIKPNGLQKIQHREKIINEIISTEQKYCVNMTILLNYFGKKFLEEKIISESDYDMMFLPVRGMIRTSNNLQDELTKHKIYSSCIAHIFSNFLFNFQKTSEEYFANYNTKIAQMTEELDSNPKVQEICKASPKISNTQGDVTYQMMAIQPIQRFPRYPLLLGELLKYTPKSHPDYLSLIKVNNQIKDMVAHMENAHLIKSVKSIQDRLVQNSGHEPESIVTPDRLLISDFKVFIHDKKKIPSALYLFNDLILLTAFQKQGKENEQFHEIEIEVLRCRYDKFIFIPSVDNSTILLYFNNEYKKIEFKNPGEVQKFHESLSDLRNKILEEGSQNNLPNIKSIEYFPSVNQIIPSMINTSCDKIGGLINVFSNRAYITYDTRHKSLTIQTEVKNISHQEHGKLVIINGIPYIYGGLKKAGPFELRDNKFIIAENSKPLSEESQALMGIINAEKIDAPKGGLKYHTCCAYDKFIVVFGGKNTKNKNLYSNEVFFYSVESGEWFSTKIKSDEKPEARYKHTSVVYKNIMIIHGGRSCLSKRILKDIWLFNFLNGKWSMINVNRDYQIMPRFGHSSAIVNRFMFVIGGLTNSNSNSNSNLQSQQSGFITCDFPDSSDENLLELELVNDSNISFSTEKMNIQNKSSMGKYEAASDCFCLNLETGDIDNIEIEGNFIHGLTKSSAIYDETNKEIVVFGGTDPLNYSINGLSIVLTLNIPTQYKSDESKPPEGPAKTNKLISITEANIARNKSYSHLILIQNERKVIDEKTTNDEKAAKNEKPIQDEKVENLHKAKRPSNNERETNDEKSHKIKRPTRGEKTINDERETEYKRPTRVKKTINDERETEYKRPTKGKREAIDYKQSDVKSPIKCEKPHDDNEEVRPEPRRRNVRIIGPTIHPVNDDDDASHLHKRKKIHRASAPNIKIVYQEQSYDNHSSRDDENQKI